jgi:integrase
MKLAALIEQYIDYKRSLGMVFKSPAVCLKAFLAEISDVPLDTITPKQVLTHLDGKVGPTTYSWFSKYQTLRPFFRFAIDRGHLQACPLPKVLPKKPPGFRPYIYTVAEVKRLLDAADSRHQVDWLLDPHTSRTMILLLYGTGLRIGEATRLKLDDVDLDNQILTIKETKFVKSRLVPVGDDLAKVLRSYHECQWTGWTPMAESTFLSCRERQPIKHQTARLVFYRMRAEAKVWREQTASFQPRLHDFRHTFAVTRLVTWYREGKNVQRLLPHLSTYLGHARLQETTRYLNMTKELMQEASRCFERYALPREARDG